MRASDKQIYCSSLHVGNSDVKLHWCIHCSVTHAATLHHQLLSSKYVVKRSYVQKIQLVGSSADILVVT